MINIEQRTDEWKQQRRGKFTASEIHKLMGIKGLGKTGETYIIEKVAEELGATMPEVSTYAMQWGTETESYAKRFYSKAFKCSVSEQPFIIAQWCDVAGCSPDGLVTEWDENNNPLQTRKGLEVKCPYNPAHHIQNLMIKSPDEFKELRPEYYWQVQMSMAVCNLNLWDFVSYYPGIDDDYQMTAVEIPANEKDIELLKVRISMAVEMKEKILKSVVL